MFINKDDFTDLILDDVSEKLGPDYRVVFCQVRRYDDKLCYGLMACKISDCSIINLDEAYNKYRKGTRIPDLGIQIADRIKAGKIGPED